MTSHDIRTPCTPASVFHPLLPDCETQDQPDEGPERPEWSPGGAGPSEGRRSAAATAGRRGADSSSTDGRTAACGEVRYGVVTVKYGTKVAAADAVDDEVDRGIQCDEKVAHLR